MSSSVIINGKKKKSLNVLILVPNLTTIIGVALLFISLGLITIIRSTSNNIEKSMTQTAFVAADSAQNSISGIISLAKEIASIDVINSNVVSAEDKQIYLNKKASTYGELNKIKYLTSDGRSLSDNSIYANEDFF